MEEVSESREIIRQIKNDMKLLMEGKKDRLVKSANNQRPRSFWTVRRVSLRSSKYEDNSPYHDFRHELRKEGSMQILQLKCLNETCQLKVKDEWDKTENAKNQLNNKRQNHQEQFLKSPTQ